jgi:hypothetical protein
MKSFSTSLSKIHVVRLMKDEDLLDSLTSFIRENEIKSGFINGIGALSTAQLGYFDGTDYQKIVISENVELTSLTGNIALLNGQPMLHIHALVSDPSGTTKGGHVFSGCIIDPTGEFIIYEFTVPMERSLDPSSGLNLLNL